MNNTLEGKRGRRPSKGSLFLASAGLLLGSLLSGYGILFAKPTGAVTSTRLQAFPDGDIPLGQVCFNSRRVLPIKVRNFLDTEVYLFGLRTSCGCVAPNFAGGVMEPNSEIEIQVVVTAKQNGPLKEHLFLEASHERLDGLGVTISGQVQDTVSLLPLEFGALCSESGGTAVAHMRIRESPRSLAVADLVSNLKNAGFHSGTRALGLDLDVDSITWTRTAKGGYDLTAEVNLAPSSYRGRLSQAHWTVVIPDALGGGFLEAPIRAGLIPNIRVEPQPVLQVPRLLPVSPADASTPHQQQVSTFVVQPERSGQSIHFPQSRGQHPLASWEVEQLPGDATWSLTVWPTQLAADSALSVQERTLQIPCRLGEEPQLVSVSFVAS